MDLVTVFVFLVFAGILIFIGLRLLNGTADSLGQSDAMGTTVDTVRNGAATGFNAGVLLMIGILFVAAAMSTIFLDVHPAYIWIGFFIGSLVVWVLFNSSDVVDNAIPQAEYAREISQMPQGNAAIRGLPWIILGIFALLLVGTYAKSRFQQL